MKRHSQTMRLPLGRSLPNLLRSLLAIALCQACCGCTLLTNGSHILLTDPLHFPNNVNHLTTRHRTRKIAKQYLNDLYCANPDFPASKEYSDGFLDGFEDYITYGERQAPPALPPRRYWKKDYATPDGFGAVYDWHAGFADGSLEAASTGLRELQMVPSSLVVTSFEPAVESEVLPAPIPEPAINGPAEELTAEEMSPEEFQIFLESQDEQAMQQARPLREAAGGLQPAGDGDRWSQLADPTVWEQGTHTPVKHDQPMQFQAEQAAEQPAAHAWSMHVDSSQFDRVRTVRDIAVGSLRSPWSDGQVEGILTAVTARTGAPL